jgi:hypothetical protein
MRDTHDLEPGHWPSTEQPAEPAEIAYPSGRPACRQFAPLGVKVAFSRCGKQLDELPNSETQQVTYMGCSPSSILALVAKSEYVAVDW